MFCKILVAFDRSPQSIKALETGIDLANLCSNELHVVTVAEDLPAFVTVGIPEMPISPEVIVSLEEQRNTYYEEVRQDAIQRGKNAGVTVEAIVVYGPETQTIVDYAKKIHADLLIVGLHKHPAIIDHLWGSTAQKLALSAPCSILAVK